MKRSGLSKVAMLIVSASLLAASLTGCRMNLPDTSGIGPDAKKEADGDGDDTELVFEDDDAESNQDVTAGTLEDGSYSLSAFINDQTYVYVDAPEVVLKEKEPKKPVDVKDKDGDMSKARLAYLTAYYEGDETSAKEDLEDYEIGTLTDGQKKAIKALYPELGKIFAQFNITTYDMTAPTDADEDFVEYDVYSADNEPFLIDLTFEGDAITDVTISYDGELE